MKPKDDVVQLFNYLGEGSAETYQEIVQDNDNDIARSRWPILSEIQFGLGGESQPAIQEATAPDVAPTVRVGPPLDKPADSLFVGRFDSVFTASESKPRAQLPGDTRFDEKCVPEFQKTQGIAPAPSIPKPSVTSPKTEFTEHASFKNSDENLNSLFKRLENPIEPGRPSETLSLFKRLLAS